ncbi:MAG: universal stress protein [Tepidiformaceae bacterium]
MRFLVTTDRSESSLRTIPHAAALARAASAEIVLLRVFDPRLDAVNEIDPSLASASQRVAARWQIDLEQVAREHGVQGPALVVIKGQREAVRDTIVRVADEQGVALIAMGTGGASKLRHLFVGSVATGVVASKTPLAVMLTRADMREPRAGATYRLLVTNDGSPAAMDVIRELAPVLAQVGPEVTLLRAHQAGAAADLLTELEAVAREFPEGVHVTPRVESLGGQMKAADVILRVAEEVGADAIAMSTHGHSALRHVFAGSVTMDVLGASPIPVIVGRAG